MSVYRYVKMALWPRDTHVEDVCVLYGLEPSDALMEDPFVHVNSKEELREVVMATKAMALDPDQVLLQDRIPNLPGAASPMLCLIGTIP